MQPYLSLNPRCNLFVDLFANFLLAIFVVNELIRHALRLQVCKKSESESKYGFNTRTKQSPPGKLKGLFLQRLHKLRSDPLRYCKEEPLRTAGAMPKKF